MLRPYVFVTVGTDHHPFQRLVHWIDAWRSRRGDDVEVFVQYGTAEPPSSVPCSPYLAYQEMQRHLDRATAVVTHGGPGCIYDARARGILPIVVPRDPGRGEHVDGHQQTFASLMGQRGHVVVPPDFRAFCQALDLSLERRPAPIASSSVEPAAVQTIRALVEGLFA